MPARVISPRQPSFARRLCAGALAFAIVFALGACRPNQPNTLATAPAPSPTPAVATPSSTAPTTTTPSAAPSPGPATTATADALPSVGFGVAATLRVGGRVAIAGTGWTLTFREVTEDNRCPVDVQCVWAGQATVRLIAEHAGGRSAALEITLSAGAPASTSLDGLTVEAAGLAPAPRAGTPIAPDAYAVTVRVSR